MTTSNDQPGMLELRASVLAEQGLPIGLPLAALCFTCLPHREVPLSQGWVRQFSRSTMAVESTAINMPGPKGAGTHLHLGIPYGPRPRLLMLHFWREVRRTGRREIERSVSFRQYFDFLGLSAGGKTYRSLRDQAQRLGGCRLLFAVHAGNASGSFEERFLDGGLIVRDEASDRLRYETVILSTHLFESLRDEPMPFSRAAIRHMANNAFALDLFCWLAVTLPRLAEPARCSWQALYGYFGLAYGHLRHFKPRMIAALEIAHAHYRAAAFRVDDEAGVLLQPSPPPPERDGA